MLVSVLTPSYNQGEWLADNLRSVEKQTYPDIEHIVMDGGSTDDSVQLLAQCGERVRWKSESDRGQSHALNKAFAASQGDIIGWLNSDDAYVDVRSVESAVELFRRYPDVGVVYGHGLLVNRTNRVLQFLWTPTFNRAAMLRNTFFVQPSVFIRRSVIDSPLVNEGLHYVMDRDLWWRLMDKTEFRRLDMVVGLDRYQPARKTLQTGYPEERDRYVEAAGIDPHSKVRAVSRRVQNVLYRLRGIPNIVRLPSSIQPAIELEFGSVTSRVMFQAATLRRRMPLS